MLVRLLKSIEEDGRIKATRIGTPREVVFTKGAVIDVSEATGAKWIAAGIAEAVTEETQP